MAHKIIIDPGYGYSDTNGKFTAGPCHERMIGWELCDAVVNGLVEELTLEGISFDVLPTRKAPGLTPDQRAERMDLGAIVVAVAMGHGQPISGSRTGFSALSKDLATKVHKAMMTWGKTITFLHADLGCKPDKKLYPTAQAVEIVEIAPIVVDAPGAFDSANKLEALGRELGRVIAKHAKEGNPHLGVRFAQAREKSWLAGAR